MALRKIKDLIREMVFDNQSNVHQYAEVMANLVFDRNQADEYEKQIDNAQKTTADYDIKIKEINAELDKAKSSRNEIVSRKKEMPVEKFKSAMADINKDINVLETKQRETIAEKIQKSFVSLDPVIKKYACLRYLSNEYVKNADFKTEIGADGFIYADEYEFKSSEMARNFREISDYVDYIFGNRNSKITEPKSIVEIIKRDAAELNLPVEKLTPTNIVEIYNSLLARIAEENRNKQSEKEQIELSQIGIEPIQDFGDGLVMYRLLPDTEYYNEHHKHRNLVYEGNQMGICIGQEQQSYSQKIFDLKKNQYYSLRKKQPNGQLIPHCTIEVNGDTVSQVKGKSNGMVNGNYIQPVREFLKQHLNVAFPGEENTKNKRQLYDNSNIGFIWDLHRKTVDLFNLPPNTEFNELSYDLLSVKGIDLKNIKSINVLVCEKTNITQQHINTIAKFPITILSLLNAKLHGKYDFSNINVKEINLSYSDLTDAEITLPKSIEIIYLSDAKLHGKLDLSNTNLKGINLTGADLTDAEITLPKSIERINLYCAKLRGKYDFSNTNLKVIELRATDLTKTEIIFPKSIEEISLCRAKLRGKYDFSNTNLKEIYLIATDLTNAEIIVTQNTKIVGLNEKYKNKIVVLQSESKVDLLNKGIKNLKNRLNIDTQQSKEKISVSDREND